MPTTGVSMQKIGQLFIEAFNRRDAEALVGLCAPEIEFRPTVLVGARRVYHGHDGLRRWVGDLASAMREHQVRLREVRPIDERRFALLSEVLLDGELISPSAMIARLTDEGKIVEAHAYLSDEELLTQLGFVPGGNPGRG